MTRLSRRPSKRSSTPHVRATRGASATARSLSCRSRPTFASAPANAAGRRLGLEPSGSLPPCGGGLGWGGELVQRQNANCESDVGCSKRLNVASWFHPPPQPSPQGGRERSLI